MNKVILIGGSHHNGLGLVRSFGVNKISPYGVIVGENAEKSFVRASKYWAKTWAVADERQAIDLLLREFSNEDEKPVIIPWSDGAAEEIDKSLNTLKEKFILPSIGGEEGRIVELMDKKNQVEFAKRYGIPMANSWEINLSDIRLPDDIIYPCIIKPVISTEGKKKDIRKCDTRREALSYLEELKLKGYHRFLVQEFLKCNYEFEFCGSINGNIRAYTTSKDTRIWPPVGGTNSFFECISDERITEVCVHLLDALQSENYSGCFDIEMFYSDKQIYLNEINWRNTGNSFFALGTNVHYAVVWYYSVIGKSIPKHISLTCSDVKQCAMNESTDLRQAVCGNITWKQWLNDRKKCQSFALWYRPDLKPTLLQYMHLAKELVKRRGV